MPNKPKPTLPTTWHAPMVLPSVGQFGLDRKPKTPTSKAPSYPASSYLAPNYPGKGPSNTPNYNTNTGKSSWDKFMEEVQKKWSNPNAGWYGITTEGGMYGLQTHPSTWQGAELQEAKYLDPNYGKGGLAVNQGHKWTAAKTGAKHIGGGSAKPKLVSTFQPMKGTNAYNGGYAVDPGTFLPGVTNPEDKPIEWSEAITQQDEYHKYMQQYMNQLYGVDQGPIMYQKWFENQYGVAAEEDPLAQQKAYDEWMKGQLSPEEYKEWSENYYGYEPDEDPLEQQKAYDEWMKGQLTPEQYAEWSENYYGYEGEPVSDEVKLMDDMRKYLVEQYGEVEGMKQYNKWMTRNYKGLGNTYAQSTSGMGAGMVNWRT